MTSTIHNALNLPDLVSLVNSLSNLNAVYLGIAVSLLIFLGGAFYIFNIKPFIEKLNSQEKNIIDLEKQTKQNLNTSKEEFGSKLDNFRDEQLGGLEKILGSHEEKMLSKVEKQIITFENEFTKKFNSFAENKDDALKKIISAEHSEKINAVETNLKKILEKENNKQDVIIYKLANQLESLEIGCKDLKRVVRELEVYKYSKEGQMGAIYGLIDLLKEDIDENSWRIEERLEDLNKEIDGVLLNAEGVTAIEEQLIRLDDKPKYNPRLSKIRRHYTGK